MITPRVLNNIINNNIYNNSIYDIYDGYDDLDVPMAVIALNPQNIPIAYNIAIQTNYIPYADVISIEILNGKYDDYSWIYPIAKLIK